MVFFILKFIWICHWWRYLEVRWPFIFPFANPFQKFVVENPKWGTKRQMIRNFIQKLYYAKIREFAVKSLKGWTICIKFQRHRCHIKYPKRSLIIFHDMNWSFLQKRCDFFFFIFRVFSICHSGHEFTEKIEKERKRRKEILREKSKSHAIIFRKSIDKMCPL